MRFIKKEMMFDSCLMSAKSDDENPKRKKGEKNVLTHAFSSFESHTRFSHILKVSSSL